MIGIQIKELKDFMGKLLKSECFDSFLLEEALISTSATYTIDGKINADFYTPEEKQDTDCLAHEFLAWKDIRPLCFDLIKGKRTPLNFKFVLQLMPEYWHALMPDDTSVKAAVLTIKYDGSVLTLVTGISYHTFVLDKTPDRLWDSSVEKFLDKKDIKYELL